MSVFRDLYVKKNLVVDELSTFTGAITASNNLTVSGNTYITGNLTVNGTTTSVSSDNVLIKDKFMMINSENTSTVPTSGLTEGGFVVNYGTDATIKDITVSAYVTGVEGTQSFTAGSAVTLSDGDFILVSGSANNDGLWEVHGAVTASTTITVKSTTLSKLANTTVTAETLSGTPKLAKVGISVIRSTIAGVLETASGSNGALTYAQITTGGSSPTLTLPKINDTSSDHTYNFLVSELTANRNITLPLLTANDTFVFESHTQTLSGKTLTLPKINDTSSDHTYDLAVSELTANRTVTLPLLTANDTFVFESHSQTLSGKTLTLPKINDTSSDHTYDLAVSELTANRTVTLPLLTANDTFVFESHSQTLSGKTLTLPKINDTSSDHTYDLAVSELTANRTVTLPLLTASDTFVFESHTQTLTNKTLVQSITAHADAAYTITLSDSNIHTFTPSVSRVVSLPAVATVAGHTFKVIMLSGAGSLVITPTDGTIEGSATLTLDTSGQHISLTCDGSNWFINL